MVIMKKKILIAAGGTGGHIFPGVAIASEFVARGGYTPVFAGTRRGLEEKIVGAKGWQLYFVSASAIKGRSIWQRLLSLFRLPLAMVEALRIITLTNPALVVSIGGYAAGPLAIVAWIMRIPVVIVEPNAIPGLSNRILGRFAKKIFISFGMAASRFNPKKVIKSGTPVREEILKVARESEEPGQPFTVFVFGGSQGAARLNRAIIEACAKMKDRSSLVRVIHQTGALENIKDLKDSYLSSGVDAEVYDFVDNIWECYSKADFVIARSGAGAVAELMALKIPSVLVPYPYAADDHQKANARSLVETGGAIMISDEDCTGERIASIISSMLNDPAKYRKMKKDLAKLDAKNAASRIVDECIKLFC